jgi:hypothetical protein
MFDLADYLDGYGVAIAMVLVLVIIPSLLILVG